MQANFDAVIDAMNAYGIDVGELRISGRIIRRPMINKGRSDDSGRYKLYEYKANDGQIYITGYYGSWIGNEFDSHNIKLNLEFSPEEKKEFAKKRADDKRNAEAYEKAINEKAAIRAEQAWNKLLLEGESDYLIKKGVKAYGLRFTEKGSIAIPMRNKDQRIIGLHFIFSKATNDALAKTKRDRNKEFWPKGVAKKASFHLIGGIPDQAAIIVEGYATGATIYDALNHKIPVIVAFDANNIGPVIDVFEKKYPGTKIVIAADDDRYSKCGSCQAPIDISEHPIDCPACKTPHKRKNTGVTVAQTLSIRSNVSYISPIFADNEARFQHFVSNKGKLSDFNDLFITESLSPVSQQLIDHLDSLGCWKTTKTLADITQGGGESNTLKPIDTADELLERFSLVYAKGGMVFDHQEHLLLTLSDMRDSCQTRDIHRRWQESPQRSIVRCENVGFDPAGEDKNITCNLWAGWPTASKQGDCDKLLGLLYHMCSGEQNSMDLAIWVIKWLAYPIQHPGSKMRTTLVLHGPQGTGKNLFFEAIMDIYGHYGRIIDQSAIEDKFNDWASRKLFLIADEVVARSDLYHVKNKLKAFITGEWIRVNPKNMAAYEEKNHVNLVFLSNERMPVVIEEDDRRHCVIWTPPKKEADFYKQVYTEIKNGGIAALHHYLLSIDLGDFDEHAKPPMTNAKAELLELSKDNILRFYECWQAGDIDGVPNVPVLSDDIYDLYKHWCGRQGVKPSPMNRAIDHLAKKASMNKERKRFLNGSKQSNPKTFLYAHRCEEMNPGNSESAW